MPSREPVPAKKVRPACRPFSNAKNHRGSKRTKRTSASIRSKRELAAGAGVPIEFAQGWGLVQSDAAGDDFGSSVTLRPDRNTGCTAQHRKLTDVRQRVRQWTLDEHLGGMAPRSGRSKKLIQSTEAVKEPSDVRISMAASPRTP